MAPGAAKADPAPATTSKAKRSELNFVMKALIARAESELLASDYRSVSLQHNPLSIGDMTNVAYLTVE